MNLNQKLYTLFLCIFLMLNSNKQCTAQKKFQSDVRAKILDITKALSDSEIETALSDLSLNDLNALSNLIDTSKNSNVQETKEDMKDRTQLANAHATHADDDSASAANIESDNYADDAYISEDDTAAAIDEEPEAYAETPISQFKNVPQASRAKRADRSNEQDIKVDEEYIKQLENSFPRNFGSSSHDELSEKKDHVRIKRNRTHRHSGKKPF